MIAITTKYYDPLGHLIADGRGILDRGEERRVSVTRTLDAGVQIDDAGWSPADRVREFVIYDPTEDQIERAHQMVTIHSEHRLFMRGVPYIGELTSYRYDPPELRLNFQIESEDT